MTRTALRPVRLEVPAIAPAEPDQALDGAVAIAWPRVYGYAWLLLRNREDAEDVAAEAFARAYRALAEGHPPRGEIVPWLLLIARRLVIDRQRRRRLVSWLSLRSVREEGIDDAGLAGLEARAWFEQLRGALSPRQYEAVVLRYLFDLGDDEIGQLMGLSQPGVRTLVSRAVGRLRRHPEVLEP